MNRVVSPDFLRGFACLLVVPLYTNRGRKTVWTAIGFVGGGEKLGLWFRLSSWFSFIPDGFLSGFGVRAGIEVWSDRSQCLIHDFISLVGFLLVWYILLVDEFFPAWVALNDICCCVVVAYAGSFCRSSGGHTCSWWRSSQRMCTAIPGVDMKNRHTFDGLAVLSRQFCRAFWRQVGSHVFLLWRGQQFFSSR